MILRADDGQVAMIKSLTRVNGRWAGTAGDEETGCPSVAVSQSMPIPAVRARVAVAANVTLA
jgi:hypothetical protein